MTQHFKRWMATLVLVIGVSTTSEAQELRRDPASNGVLIGAATGAAAGAVVGLATEEICSPAACAYLGSVAGGLLGLVIDRKVGQPRPVTPGAWIDDGLGNGALLGALGGTGIVLIDASVRCRPRPDHPPCTRKGVLIEAAAAARWMALVGLVVDAAIPSKVPPSERHPTAVDDRRVAVRVNLRF
jgi:hypothetical protein